MNDKYIKGTYNKGSKSQLGYIIWRGQKIDGKTAAKMAGYNHYETFRKRLVTWPITVDEIMTIHPDDLGMISRERRGIVLRKTGGMPFGTKVNKAPSIEDFGNVPEFNNFIMNLSTKRYLDKLNNIRE